MSATYTLFSPLSPQEMIDLADRCGKLVADYFEEHPDCMDEWGEMSAGGRLPGEDEVREAYRQLRLPLDPDVLVRLARCRSLLSIHRPGDIETVGGLQVSILRHLLDHAGDAMLLLNDYPLESSEHLLARLRSKAGAKGFGVVEPPKRRTAARREAKPGEVRAIRVLAILERAISDVRVAIDVKATLESVSGGARNYGALLLEGGVVTDAQAAKALGITRADLVAAADELDRALAASAR